jgi:[ribosomal protein S5]-alanine N-acetyltransferase
MKIFAETERLLLREILPEDESGFFELDANPEVHRFLGNKPVKSMDEVRAYIKLIRQQYEDYGIGRWAVVEKKDNQFIGWAGLKYITQPINNNRLHYYDIGYRLNQKYWGLGYATEAAIIARDYAFDTMKLDAIYGCTHIDNHVSRHILEKIGLRFVETFPYQDMICNWLEMKAGDWKPDRL